MKKNNLFLLMCMSFMVSYHSLVAQNGLDFDGINDQVQTTFNGVLGSSNRTFEAWIYITNTPSANIAILDYGLNAVGSRNTFIINPNLALGFISGGTNANISSTTNTIPVGQWAHVAFVLNNGTGFLYLNGNQIGTGSLSSVNTPTGNQAMRIGQRVTGGSIPFQGKIDEVRVWNTARTQQELMNNMNRELCTLSPNLVAYYQMNEGIAGGTNTGLTTVPDLSGNNNNGTLTSFSLTGATSNWTTGASLNGGFTSSSQTMINCDSFTWSANNTTYYASGIHNTTLPGANANGCDSMLTLDLTVNYSSVLSSNITSCGAYTWPVNGLSYTSNGFYTDTLTSISGCDSIHTLNLTINNSTASSITDTTCNAYIWTANGLTYTSSGLYTDTLTNSNGCDSILTLNLTINNSTTSTIIASACDSFTWTTNGLIYTSSGFYADTLTNSNGCDSIVILDLSIDTLDNSITNTGDSLFSNQSNAASYQWLDCDNNYALITGATSSVFSPTQVGNYAVAVVNGACTDTSNCEIITTIQQISTPNLFSIYPNPAKKEFTINITLSSVRKPIQIFNIHGILVKEIFTQNQMTTIDISELVSGVYFIQYGSDLKKLVLNK